MRRAIELARKGEGFTSPNPCVGAVIVKGGEIVAEGWHMKAGEKHAEIVAIDHMMKKSGIVTVDLEPALFHNATLYVTLEPCCHHGKTAPCVKTIAQAGFNKVCIGMKDPFRKVNGRGIKYLKKHDIEVEICRQGTELAAEIKNLNQPFIKWAETGLPYVVMKTGMSLDGKIATAGGQSRWITGEKSRQDARFERSKCDAVLVGAGTVKNDDPKLATVAQYKKKNLLRIVVDNDLSLSLESKIFRDKNVFVVCSNRASVKNKARFKKAGIPFKVFGKTGVSIFKLLKYLGAKNMQSVFVEGGSGVNGSFYDEAMSNSLIMDKIIYYIAPLLIGGEKSLSVIGGVGAEKLSQTLRLKSYSVNKIGDDMKIEGVFNLY